MGTRRAAAAPSRWPLLLSVLGLVPIGFGVWGVPHYTRDLPVVGRPASKAERAKGIVRGQASFHPEGSVPVPPCLASYRSGKSTNRFHFTGDNRVEVGTRTYALSAKQRIEFFADDAPQRQAGSSAPPGPIRDHLTLIKPATAKSLSWIGCLTPRETAWVEACVADDDELTGCAPGDPVLITVAGPAARISYLTSHAHGSVALLLCGVAIILSCLASAFHHGRRVIVDLAQQRNIPRMGLLNVTSLGLGVLASTASVIAWPTTIGPSLFCAAVTVVIMGLFALAIGRLRRLRAARSILLSSKTTRLDSPGGGARELAVRIPHDAPQVEGFYPGYHHALVQFQVIESYKHKHGNKVRTETRDLFAGRHPSHVVIEDASGRGYLALDHCILDAPDMQTVYWPEGTPPSPGWFAQVVPRLERSETHVSYGAVLTVLEPGDPLLIFGAVERVPPPAAPLVRGTPGAQTIVHVGLESSLLAGIGTERTVLVVAVAIGVCAWAASMGAFVWILQL